jgi:hypothetical protein
LPDTLERGTFRQISSKRAPCKANKRIITIWNVPCGRT